MNEPTGSRATDPHPAPGFPAPEGSYPATGRPLPADGDDTPSRATVEPLDGPVRLGRRSERDGHG
jgi:hypothetical protein